MHYAGRQIQSVLNCLYRIQFTGERAMSPAQSEDSGLAVDRSTTYATISLPRENAQAMGIVFLGNFKTIFLRLTTFILKFMFSTHLTFIRVIFF